VLVIESLPLRRSAVLFVLGLLAAVSPAVLAGGPCIGEAPTSVLECLSQAYETRDLETIEALYAPDFEFWFGTEESHTSWGREDEIKSAANMFTHGKVQAVSLEFDVAREVVSGTEPNTWILRGVDSRLTIKASDSAEPYLAELKNGEFRVRRIAEPTPHWQIYRWTDPNER
jgi:hypothetical protein